MLPTNVLSIPLIGKNKGHPAVFPVELPSFFIKLLSRENALIIDPFSGRGTTGVAALLNNRNCLLVDNNQDYRKVAHHRLQQEAVTLYHEVKYYENSNNDNSSVAEYITRYNQLST